MFSDNHSSVAPNADEVPLHLQPARPVPHRGGHVPHAPQLLQREALRRALLAQRVHQGHL